MVPSYFRERWEKGRGRGYGGGEDEKLTWKEDLNKGTHDIQWRTGKD